MSTNPSHPVVVFGFKRRLGDFIGQVRSVATAIDGNKTLFPSPSPAIAQVEADITALETAQTAVIGRTKGAAQLRNAKLLVVKGDAKGLTAYVQGLVIATPAQAEMYATAAGLTIRASRAPALAPLVATLAVAPGVVDLVAHKAAPAGKTVLHEWEYSVDGGKTWTASQPTTLAHTSVAGLPSLTTVAFRHRVTTSVGPGAWSQLVTILVH